MCSYLYVRIPDQAQYYIYKGESYPRITEPSSTAMPPGEATYFQKHSVIKLFTRRPRVLGPAGRIWLETNLQVKELGCQLTYRRRQFCGVFV